MGDIHIDDFYHDIGLILSRLYSAFPNRSTLFVEDISGADTPDEFGIHSDRFMSCFSAMLWLKDQGYIMIESTIRQEGVEHAVLTEKSFLILSSQASIMVDGGVDTEHLPGFVAERAITNISLLRRALQNKSSIEISRIAFHIMEQSKAYA